MVVRIALTRGYVALVDDADARLADLRWQAARRGKSLIYAARTVVVDGRKGTEYLHRAVRPGCRMVHHLNGDPLDCRRDNLVCTFQGVNVSVGRDRPNQTGYRGVHRDGDGPRPFVARLTMMGRTRMLGRFATAEEAHVVYDAERRNHFGPWLPPDDTNDQETTP